MTGGLGVGREIGTGEESRQDKEAGGKSNGSCSMPQRNGDRRTHTSLEGSTRETRRKAHPRRGSLHSPAPQATEALGSCPFHPLTPFLHLTCLALLPSSAARAKHTPPFPCCRPGRVCAPVRPKETTRQSLRCFRGSLRGLRPGCSPACYHPPRLHKPRHTPASTPKEAAGSSAGRGVPCREHR